MFLNTESIHSFKRKKKANECLEFYDTKQFTEDGKISLKYQRE